MYFLIGIKNLFSGSMDVLDQDPSYDVLVRIKRVADMALKSDDPYVMKYKQFRIVDSIDNFKCEYTKV
jgi:hypothetical protein